VPSDYLLKTEPSEYSFADLQRDKVTVWDGVHNPVALRKNPAVEIKAGKPIAKPITLAQIKSNKLFKDSPLVRIGRLSVVPLTDAQYKFLAGD
jgi:predicted RNA-binding protein with PUA-like domain